MGNSHIYDESIDIDIYGRSSLYNKCATNKSTHLLLAQRLRQSPDDVTSSRRPRYTGIRFRLGFESRSRHESRMQKFRFALLRLAIVSRRAQRRSDGTTTAAKPRWQREKFGGVETVRLESLGTPGKILRTVCTNKPACIMHRHASPTVSNCESDWENSE